MDGRALREVAIKPVDSWWTVLFIDPIAVRILPFLLRFRWIDANVVTGVAFVVGCGAIVLFATGQFVIGAVLYELRFLLDCLDGKIARVRRTSSPLGAAFDRTADSLTIPAAFAAIGITLAHHGHLRPVLALAPALMSSMVTVLELSLELLVRRTNSSGQAELFGHGGVASWFRRHRLTLRPWTVEAEALGLFIAPIALTGDLLGDAELAIAAVFAVFVLVDLFMIARTAARPAP